MKFITDHDWAQQYRRRLALTKEQQDALDQAMINAAMAGDYDDMNACLKNGADPNARDQSGMHVLALTDNKKCFMKLLETHSDPDLAMEGGLEALVSYVLDENRICVAEVLRDYLANHLGYSFGEELEDRLNCKVHEAEWTALIDRGKKEVTQVSHAPRSSQEILNSRLIEAVNLGHRREVEKLLREGASPNARDAAGNSALKLSKFEGCTAALLRSGANVAEAIEGGVDGLVKYHANERNVRVARAIVMFHAERGLPVGREARNEMREAYVGFKGHQRDSDFNYERRTGGQLQKLVR